MSSPDTDLGYINNVDYTALSKKFDELVEIIDDRCIKQHDSRKLRYAEVDIEALRESGQLLPDEMYIPQHIIDTNIRREQAPYVQYITQSNRAVICEDADDNSIDLSILEKDLTKKLRYPGWQLPQFANIDNFQANGYGAMEVVYDPNQPGNVSHDMIQFGDFGFITDTRDIQSVEMTARAFYYTRTKLLALCGDGTLKDDFDKKQVMMVVEGAPEATETSTSLDRDNYRASLFRIFKIMFRVKGIVQVGWICPKIANDWLRTPRPLYIGRRQIIIPPTQSQVPALLARQMPQSPAVLPQQQQTPTVPQSQDVYETEFPYFIFPYLISENDTISQLVGRVYLDQDTQEGVTSLMSSTATQARRAAGMYFGKDTTDPNDEFLMQKNIFFRSGCIVNAKISAFKLDAPDPGIFNAIQMLASANQNETSQVNFAVQNRKDSRKTAKEIGSAEQQQQNLSTVQVVLFALSLTNMYTTMTDIIVSRVRSGVLKIKDSATAALYQRTFTVKPSGDTDVIERQQKIQLMMQSWPVYQNTPMAQAYLIKLTELMFPDEAAGYLAAMQQAQQQQNSQQSQMMQQGLVLMKTMANGIVKLSQHPEFFSDTGKQHAFPIVEHFADELQNLQKQLNPQGAQPHVTGQR